MPPPTQRWISPPAIANVRIVRPRSRSPFGWTRPIAPIDAPRPTGSSRAMWSIAASLGAPVTDPPGNVARRSSASADAGAQAALDGRDDVAHPGHRPLREVLVDPHGPGHADAAEVVPLEVDDHHVLGPVLAAGGDRLRRCRPAACP